MNFYRIKSNKTDIDKMSSRRVKFQDSISIQYVPTDDASVNARLKFSLAKPTKYDPQNCEICKISCNSKSIYDIHVQGKKHEKSFKKLSDLKFPCDLCSKILNCHEEWIIHLSSNEHRIMELSSFVPNLKMNEVNRCEICELNCGSNIILQSHLTGAKHKRKLKKLNMEKLIENKDSRVYCDICEFSLEPESMSLHKKSNKHKKPNVKETQVISKSKNGMKFCALCNQLLSDITEATEHYNSIDHLTRVEKNASMRDVFWCDVCKIILPNESMLESHLKGFRHYRILNRKEYIMITGPYKEKLMFKRKKEKELRAKYQKEKLEQNVNMNTETT